MLKEAKVTMGIQFNDSFGGIGKYFPSHNMIIIILVFSLFIRQCGLLKSCWKIKDKSCVVKRWGSYNGIIPCSLQFVCAFVNICIISLIRRHFFQHSKFRLVTFILLHRVRYHTLKLNGNSRTSS